MSTSFCEQIADKSLTVTERDILILIYEGKNVDCISNELGLSFLTVDFHLKNIIQKFMAMTLCMK